jgi:dipeptidyl aminopeptidase/acylaminoacyl peptidase
MLKSLVFSLVVTTSLTAVSTAAGAEPLAAAAALFGARESIGSMDLSPDGKMVAYVSPGPGATSAVNVAAIEGGTEKPIVSSSGNPDRLSWCDFVSDSRLICQIRGVVQMQGTPIGFSRLVAVGADGSNPKPLGQKSSFYDAAIRQFDGSVLDWLPGDGKHVLMSRVYVPEERAATRMNRVADGLGVDRVDVDTAQVSVVEGADRLASDFMSDGRGNVRIRENYRTQTAGEQLSSRTDYYYRPTGSKDWKQLGSFDSTTREGIIPVAVDAGIDSAYVLKKLDGRMALYRIKLDGSMATELAYSNPRVDVDDVVRVGRGQKVIGVTFAEDVRQTIYFDKEYAALAGSLAKAMPNLPLIQFAGASADGSKLLIFAGSDSDPGRYYSYDKKVRQLSEILLVRPQLENVALAKVKPISYPAVDGTVIPGYLTLPPGKAAKDLPAIVLPHGGPSSRDEWGFDWLAQFLANQGYAVLQPEYRGSDGFGDKWLQQNGFRSWKTSIGDVTAGAKWLVAQGIANPKKLAIVGWSYGGYAALQSAATEPELYRAVVAIAPVTDLAMLKEDSRDFSNSQLVAQFVGTGPHIVEGSPLQNAARIKAPVLMFHGDQDLNVAVRQSKAMDAKLHEAGKKSELVLFPGLDHQLVDSGARTKMLERIGAFLAAATQ